MRVKKIVRYWCQAKQRRPSSDIILGCTGEEMCYCQSCITKDAPSLGSLLKKLYSLITVERNTYLTVLEGWFRNVHSRIKGHAQ